MNIYIDSAVGKSLILRSNIIEGSFKYCVEFPQN